MHCKRGKSCCARGKSNLTYSVSQNTGFSSLTTCEQKASSITERGWTSGDRCEPPGSSAALAGSWFQLFSHRSHFGLNRELPFGTENAPREIIKVNKTKQKKCLGYYLPGPTGSREISDSPTSFDVDLARGRCRGRGPPWREFRLLPVWSRKVPDSGSRSAGP